jgi:hypothetical protein
MKPIDDENEDVAVNTPLDTLIKRYRSVTADKDSDGNDDAAPSKILIKRRQASSDIVSSPLSASMKKSRLLYKDDGNSRTPKVNRLSLSLTREEKPILSQGINTSKSLAENIEMNGLDYYYDIGKSASSSRILNPNQTDVRIRVERMFFEFQEKRGKPREWPEDGLEIDDCTTFMALLADSGKGAIDEKITYDYFRRLCRCFMDLVSIGTFLEVYFSFFF